MVAQLRGISAGLVKSRLCSGHPLPVRVSREQSVCLAPLGFLPIYPLCQTEEEGSREGESSGKLPRGEGGQQGKQGKYIFLSPSLSVKSPVQFLFLCLLLCCSLLLHPACLSLCPPLTRTPNPPPFTPHSFLNPKSLLPSLYQPSSILLPVPLCSPPPPSPPLRLSLLNMPPLSITPLHTPWLQHTLFSLLPLFNLFQFLPLLFSLLSSTHPVFCRRTSARHLLFILPLAVHSAAWCKCHPGHHRN